MQIDTLTLVAPDDAELEKLAGDDRARRRDGRMVHATRHRRLELAFTKHEAGSMTVGPPSPALRIRIVFDDGNMIGPGKADLLERVDRCGSIAAAGRDMQMSYKRAWELIGTLNTMFRASLVESTRGGPGGGGARLTDLGREVLALYRAVEADAAQGGQARLHRLCALRAGK